MSTKSEINGYGLLYGRAVLAGRLAAAEVEKSLATYVVHDGARVYGTMQGLCGFGWVNVRDRKFGNWLKKSGYGRADSYEGGVTVWVSEFGQSYEMKEAYAFAVAKVLNEGGVTARGGSRLD